jgi:hypothetical protein
VSFHLALHVDRKMLKIFVILTLVGVAVGQTVTGVCFCVTAGQCLNNSTGGGTTVPGGADGAGELNMDGKLQDFKLIFIFIGQLDIRIQTVWKLFLKWLQK